VGQFHRDALRRRGSRRGYFATKLRVLMRSRRQFRFALLATLPAWASCAPTSPLTIELRDGQPWLVTEEPFSRVSCFDSESVMWVALCTGQGPCTASVRYGDSSSLNPAVDAKRLLPNRCYRCIVHRGTGHGASTSFRFDESGAIEQCTLDLLGALDAWVEDDAAPGDLVAYRSDGAALVPLRPLCRYPTYPHYGGAGDPNSLSSFRCVAPAPSP